MVCHLAAGIEDALFSRPAPALRPPLTVRRALAQAQHRAPYDFFRRTKEGDLWRLEWSSEAKVAATAAGVGVARAMVERAADCAGGDAGFEEHADAEVREPSRKPAAAEAAKATPVKPSQVTVPDDSPAAAERRWTGHAGAVAGAHEEAVTGGAPAAVGCRKLRDIAASTPAMPSGFRMV